MPRNPMQQDATHSDKKGKKRWRKAGEFWHIDKRLIRVCKQEVSVRGAQCVEEFKGGKESAVQMLLNATQLHWTSLKRLNECFLLHDRIDTKNDRNKSASSQCSTRRWRDCWSSACSHQCWAAWLPPLGSAPTPSYQGPKVTKGASTGKQRERPSAWSLLISVFFRREYLEFTLPSPFTNCTHSLVYHD